MNRKTEFTEPEWGIEIVRAENGYTMEYPHLLGDDTWRTNRIVVEDSEGNEVRAFIKLVYELGDYFGIYRGFEIREVEE